MVNLPTRRLVLESGTVYEGEFSPDGNVFHGTGTLTMPDGGEYRGEWVDGKHHGKGTLSLPSGHIYTGNWSRGKKSGFGVQTDDSGQRYAGEWSDGRQHGVGTITHRSGDSYSGQWQAGVPHGNGVMTKKGGLAISGTWLDGKKQASWAMAQATLLWRKASAIPWMPPLKRWMQVVLTLIAVRVMVTLLPWIMAEEFEPVHAASSYGPSDPMDVPDL